jgi:hypothetical protein
MKKIQLCSSIESNINVRRVRRYQRIRTSKKNRQHNDQKKKYKRTNNDQQNIHIKLMIEQREPH